MIIFFGGAEIAIILVILIAIVAGSAEAIINLTNFFIILFAIKNVIQTVILGYFKNKNPLSYTLGFAVTDTIRMFIFFRNLRSVSTTFVNATGLGYFGALLEVILYFVICGSIFLLGEYSSLVQALGNKRSEQNQNNRVALFGGIFTVILLAFTAWLFYL